MTALVAGCALLCWPNDVLRIAAAGFRYPDGRGGHLFTTRGGRRLTTRQGRRLTTRGAPAATAGRWLLGLILVVASVIWLTVGAAVAMSALILLATAAGLTRAELRRRRAASDLVDLLAGVRTLAREVRSGAQPAAAVTAVATACRGPSGPMLERLAMLVAADRGSSAWHAPGGPVPETGVSDPASEISGRLAAGWALSARYGVPWVGLIDALAADLDDRVRANAARAAQVSGPRVSGYVLAVMPALGLLLGAGMGANPLGILLETGAGHLMLLTGCTLTCAGLWWTARIVRG